jgi:molybdopterin synthase catalytic subunit
VSDPIRLLLISESPLDIAQVYAAVQDSRAGGTAVFVGTVRERDGDKPVLELEYTAHPSADVAFRSVVEDVAARYDVVALAAIHRVGKLEIGDVAVVTAAASMHRAEAFEACRALIDDLKRRLPIWKHQTFADGTEQWVGTP